MTGKQRDGCTPSRGRRWADDGLLLLAVVLFPLLGAWLAGRDVDRVFHFPPPLEIPTDYLRFSWWAVVAVIAALAGLVFAWLAAPRAQLDRKAPVGAQWRAGSRTRSMPSWGWVAVGWTLLWWVLAWTRWTWFGPLQPYTFFPLWVGFIVTVNALAQRRAGTCLLLRNPGCWLMLFAASALFWWIFEWLNRFVRNWHYLGVVEFGPLGYAGHASICFSTVLPAVYAVAEWLDTHRGWRTRTAVGPSWRVLASRRGAWLLIGGGSAALVLTGAFPKICYPALWVAPLALFLGGTILRREAGVARDVAEGRWGRAITWMVAALVCGIFWEMWNAYSLAKWIYTVPGVERWFVFEMPLLGFAGYLPFGVECLAAVERINQAEARSSAGAT